LKRFSHAILNPPYKKINSNSEHRLILRRMGIETVNLALDLDKKIPSSESWHRDLLSQMAAVTEARPAVITTDLVKRLAELLAFRHLFRGASIALMRWDKLSPLVANVDGVYEETVRELNQFQRFLRRGPTDPEK